MVTREMQAAIIAISDRNGGLLQPEDVVDVARSPESVLHSAFEWDNLKAAAEHRLATARSLIRQVRLEITVTQLTAPVRVPMFGRNMQEGGYATLDLLRKDDDLARAAAVSEFQRAAQALRRAQAIAIELGLGDEAVATVETLIRSVRTMSAIFPKEAD